jgi:hypothetical protein
MPFPAIWALNYELQYDFKKGKPWKLCHISEFDFLCTPPLHPLPPINPPLILKYVTTLYSHPQQGRAG